jgi:lipopolysaccharide transport system ATP-binding protein
MHSNNDDDVTVRVRGLGKKYLVPQRHETEDAAAPGWRSKLKEFFPGLLGAGEMDYFWALRDVSFDVRRGEVFGIVGQNGSGKSTLLKILSGITPPNEGEAIMRGRVGSLLEVGTGFHPDLTGRENVFFNGSLLGIRQSEIREKLEDIIRFSGIGEFIDVPVKRYSSGMYVRLAFSVAALLQSDIMILDEVLAVGDAAFRAKTEKGIEQAIEAGRTVLFVSHNPKSVASICDRGMILHKGRKIFEGDAKDVLAEYLSGEYLEIKKPGEPASQGPRVSSYADLTKKERFRSPSLPEPAYYLRSLTVLDREGNRRATFGTGEEIVFQIAYGGINEQDEHCFSVLIHNSIQERVATIHSTNSVTSYKVRSQGLIECRVPQIMLGDGMYSVMVDVAAYNRSARQAQSKDCVSHCLNILINGRDYFPGQLLTENSGGIHPAQWRSL